MAFVALAVVGYALFYTLGSIETQGAGALGLVNTIGLVTVALGIVVAVLVLKRSSRT